MTKISRLGESPQSVNCFPDEKLIDAVARLMNDEEDGNVTGFNIVGKKYLPGDLERPVSKFHGRMVEVTTDKPDSPCIQMQISDF
eukprot:m.15316 g.15316  ORF g.15316 m.15316 type:complete len:85 (-) comp10443_c0_seq1:178-432(-)